MKILHLLYSGLGGTGSSFFSLIKADENKKFGYEAIFAGVEDIRPEYITKCSFFKLPWKYLRKRRGVDMAFNRELVSTVKTSRSSIVLLHGSRFILLAKIAVIGGKNKKRVIVVETQSNQLKTNAEWAWLAVSLLFADHLVFLTDEFKQEICKKFPLIYRPNRCSVINNGIDLTFFTPALKGTSKTIVLGMQSRIVAIKDHTTLIHAFALLQSQYTELDLLLKIAGDGSSLPEMKELARQLQVTNKIQFTGTLNEPELVCFLQSLDIYVHASLGETMSTALMQAMACKLPIVASDVPGINNMITDRVTGLLVPVQDKTALAKSIHSLINDRGKAASLKEAAYNFAKTHYSNKTMFAKYAAIFEK
ncbi:MAG: glycosyltransferase family 4 protein [Ferruginibacter sp.]